MNKQEWKFLVVLIISFAIIGLVYVGREKYIKKNEEEYVPDFDLSE